MTSKHGISATETPQGIMSMRNANNSTIGIIVISSDADDDMYPLDTPVLLNGIKQDNIDKAGTDGTLKQALQQIRNIYNPSIIVLRVSSVADADAVDKLDVLYKCKSMFNKQPKILIAPHIDTPIVAKKLESYCTKRRAMCYINARKDDGSLILDPAKIVAYRKTFGAREVCLLDGGFGEIEKAGPAVKLSYIVAIT